MTEQNPFNKRHVEEVSPSQRTLLDELNLPPRIRSFLEENANHIKIGLLVFLVLLVAWVFYDSYTAKQKEQANALLYRATNQENPAAGERLMEKLRQEYPSAGAATWSSVIKAQQELADNNYSEAITQYEALITKEGDDSPLYPLLEYGLASAYESAGKYQEAVNHYRILLDKQGFASIAYLALARNHEALGRTKEARENYEKAEAAEETPASVKEFIDYKLTTM